MYLKHKYEKRKSIIMRQLTKITNFKVHTKNNEKKWGKGWTDNKRFPIAKNDKPFSYRQINQKTTQKILNDQEVNWVNILVEKQ